MVQQRGKNIVTLILTLATAVLPLWVDPVQTLVGKITGTVVTALLLCVSTEKLRSQRNAILGGLALAAIFATAMMGRFGSGSLGLALAGNAFAILTQLKEILARKIPAEANAVAS